MAILTFEQGHDLRKALSFCQSCELYSVCHPNFPPIYLLLFSGGQNTEVSLYIEEDMIQLIWYDRIWYNWLIYLEQRNNLGKVPFFYPHYITIYHGMLINDKWKILIWVLVLVLDMKILDVLKYFFLINEYLTSTCTWYIIRVLGVLEYLVNCTWPQPWFIVTA